MSTATTRRARFWGGVGVDAEVTLHPSEGNATRTEIHIVADDFQKLSVRLSPREDGGFSMKITGEWERATLSHALHWIADQLGYPANGEVTFTRPDPIPLADPDE